MPNKSFYESKIENKKNSNEFYLKIKPAINPCEIRYKKLNIENISKTAQKCKQTIRKIIPNSNYKKVHHDANLSTIIKKIDKRKIIKQKSNKPEQKNLAPELYSQDYNCLKAMKEIAPKMPPIFNHVYNFKNNSFLYKKNETLGLLYKGTIPNVFYDHLMFDQKNNFDVNKSRYKKISLTQRNKKKLITILYYRP